MKIKVIDRVLFDDHTRAMKAIKDNVFKDKTIVNHLREVVDIYNDLQKDREVEIELRGNFCIQKMWDVGIHLFEDEGDMKKDIIKLAETCLSQNWYQVAGLLYQAAGLLGKEE